MAVSLSFYGLPAGPGHFLGEGLATDFAQAVDAGGAVGTEDKAEQTTDPVVELAAGHRIDMVGAGGAGITLRVQTAFSDGAPGRLGVAGAARTTAPLESAALAAIQPAKGDQAGIGG